MKNREKAKKYLKNKYYNKDENYKAILSEIRKDENMNKNKIFKTIVTTILTLLGATTIAFAGTQVYNNYIKEKNSIQSISIFDNGTGTISYETDLTQNDINIVMSHINSYKRKKLNDKSPYFMFSSIYGKDTMDKLNIKEINPNDVNLSTKLLKK